MNRMPEPCLTPPEYPQQALRCGLCLQPVTEALELYGRTVCRPCLQAQDMDDLSALLCAPIVTKEPVFEGGTL